MKTQKAERTTYEKRGVSARKEGVHSAIKDLTKGLFPGAFCTILQDYLGSDDKFVNVTHADGAGTKPISSYLFWRETGDLSYFRGNAQDSLVMNTDDMGCVGATGPFLVTQLIGRNKALIPDEVIAEIVAGCQQTCTMLTNNGVPCIYAGGETADIGDLVRTVTIDNAVTVRFPKEQVIDASNMEPGDYIVGFSSIGQTSWENDLNSGIGSNGLTNARHDVLAREYRQMKEAYCPETPRELVYSGNYKLTDPIPDYGCTVAWGLLSPTRTYLPLLKLLFDGIGRSEFHGLIHCTGGGQTKIGKFGRTGNVYVKYTMFPVPHFFQFLQKARELPWKEMYETYNMGHRLEAVVPSKRIATRCIRIAHSCGIGAQVIGRVEEGKDKNHRRVLIKTEHGNFRYKFKV